MTTRIALLSALVANIALGNACMMPMAAAAEPRDDATMYMDHGMGPMSHETNDNDGTGAPCDGTHCLRHSLPVGTSPSITIEEGAASCGAAFQVEPSPVIGEAPVPSSASPPGQFVHVDTIVLRN